MTEANSPACLRQTQLPGTTCLFADYLYDFARLASFYKHPPLHSGSLTAAAAKVDFPDARRAALVSALAEINEPSPSLELLSKRKTVAVVTGQQAGLFSGPCYTVYKALTAVRVAERLRSQGVDAVPVFWLATEDHDFEEVRHAWIWGASGQVAKFSVNGRTDTSRPVGDLTADYPVDALRRELGDLPFAGEVADAVDRAYAPGKTLGGAFLDLAKEILGGLGLLFVDPMRPAIRELAGPILRDALEAAPDIANRLMARNEELVDAGYHAQVHWEAKTSLFFWLREGRRMTLRREGAAYVYQGGKLSPAEMAAEPHRLSPNALLRPVVQDFLLPTAALIGGPAEIAYLAQTQVIYDTLGRPTPVFLPRAGFTLVDARASKLMERYSLTIPDLLAGHEAARMKIAARLVPETLGASMNQAQQSVTAAAGALSSELERFDPTLAAALAKSQAKIAHQLRKIEDKTKREILRRDQRAAGEAAYLANLIFPEQHLQERLYSIVPFLARYGPGLIDRIRENIHLDCPDHVVLPV